MVTKEQAQNSMYFYQHTIQTPTGFRSLPRPIKWRANGKCKLWEKSPEKFKLPIKHGLYAHAYLTEENAHLFEI